MDLLFQPDAWISLVTLAALEIILGIDNIVVLSVITSSLEEHSARQAQRIGLGMALAFRIVLLFFISWMTRLTAPVFTVAGQDFSWRDLILIGGGLFLMIKATQEVHAEIEGTHRERKHASKRGFAAAIFQIAIMDVIFSLDSVITAVGMAQHIEVMIAAICIAIGVMYFAAGTVGGFIKRHPTTKMLALCFLILIGVALVADGLGFHIPRGYIYFAMAFAALVETFNVWAKPKAGAASGASVAEQQPEARLRAPAQIPRRKQSQRKRRRR
jgi:predicted tellurium resistance membrane protein TerC